jgi:hypothetical protein
MGADETTPKEEGDAVAGAALKTSGRRMRKV